MTESDQKVFVFSLKESQTIQVQERLKEAILFSVEKRGALFPVLWDPEESRNPEFLPLVRPGTQAPGK